MEVLRNLCLPGNPKDKYEQKERIGQGSFGRVYKGVDKKTGDIIAIKEVDLIGVEPEDYEAIGQEIEMLKETKERHVLKFYGAYINKKDTKLWIITEFINGGNAKELTKPSKMDEMFIAIILRGIIEALVYLHEKQKIHRDIKAENILVSSDGEVKLVDFGVSARLAANDEKRHTVAGTPYWMAPEVIMQQGHDQKADIWSVGITAIELATGKVPHDDVNPMRLSVVIAQSPAPTLEGKFSPEFKHFVSVCLKKNPLERPSAKQLLQHNFIAKAKSTVYLKDLVAKYVYWKSNQREEPTDSENPHDDSSINSESDSDDSRRRKSKEIDHDKIFSYANFVVGSDEASGSNNNTPLNRSTEQFTAPPRRGSESSIDNEGYNAAAGNNRKVNTRLDYSADYYEDLEEPEDEERDSHKKRLSLNVSSSSSEKSRGNNTPSPNMKRRMMQSSKSKSKKRVRASRTLTLAEIEEQSNEESTDVRNGRNDSDESSNRDLKRQASNASKRMSLSLALPTTLPLAVQEEEELLSTTARVPFSPVSNPRGPIGMGGTLVKAAGTDVFEYRPNAVGNDNLIDMPKIELAPILDNLHKRFNSTIPYTYVDNVLISINPEKHLDIYTRLFMRNFRQKVLFQMPPHVFAVAESAYANMMNLNKAHAIILLGLSGSGKSETLKHLINYYSVLSSPLTRSDASTLLIESLTVLEAFGNAKTMLNNNGTRFILNLDLFFEPFGGLVGAKLNTYGLQKSRVTATLQKNERSFHIFYWLLAYAANNKEERKRYSLKPLDKYNYLRNGCTIVEGENAVGEYNKVTNAFSILRIDEGTRAWIFRGLSAVLMLGNVEFKHSSKKGCKISSEAEMKTVGELLDVKHSVLMNIICPDKNTFTLQEALARRDAFARGLYGQIFNHVVELLNDRLSRTVTKSMISIFDHCGFEGLEENNFEQLSVNYFAEKLHQFVNTQVIEVEQALYRGEKLDWVNYQSSFDKGPLDLVERVLSIIEDESTPKENGPKPTDESIFESIFSKLYRNPNFSSRPGTNCFQIEHTSGKIKYNADAFLRSNEEPVQFRSMLTQLPKGKNPFFNLDEEQYLLRSAAQAKVTMANISSLMMSSQLHFIACIKPGPKKNATLDPIFVRAQIKSLQLIDIAKLRSRSFSMHLSPYTFMRMFSAVDRTAVDTKEFLARNSSTAYYRLTKSKVFLRAMEYYRLEALVNRTRDDATLKLQCLFRMRLARAKLRQWVGALTKIQAHIRMKKTQERIFSQLSTKETRRIRKGGGGSSRGLSRSENIPPDHDVLSASISTDTESTPKKRRKSMAPTALALETIGSSEESEANREKSRTSRRSHSKPHKQSSMVNVLLNRGGKKYKEGSSKKENRSLHAQSMIMESPPQLPLTARASTNGSLDLSDSVTSKPSVPFILPTFLATPSPSMSPQLSPRHSVAVLPNSKGAATDRPSSGADADNGPVLKTRRSQRQFTRQPTIGRTPERPNNELISPEMRDSITASIEAENKAKTAADTSETTLDKDNTALKLPGISIVEPGKPDGEADRPRALSTAQEIPPQVAEPKPEVQEHKPEAAAVTAEVKAEPAKQPIVVDVKLPDQPKRRRVSSVDALLRVTMPRTAPTATPEEPTAPVTLVDAKLPSTPEQPEPTETAKPDNVSVVAETPKSTKPALVSKNSVRSRLAMFESAIIAQQPVDPKPVADTSSPNGDAPRSLNRRKTFSALVPSAVKSNHGLVGSPSESSVGEKKTRESPVRQETPVPETSEQQKVEISSESTAARPTMVRQSSVQNLMKVQRSNSISRTDEIFNNEFKKSLEPVLGPLELQFSQLQSAHQRMVQHLNGPSFNPTAFVNFLDMLKHVTSQFDNSLNEAIDKSKIANKSKRASADQNSAPSLAPAPLTSVKEDEELKSQLTTPNATPRTGSNSSLVTPRTSKARSAEIPSAATAPSLNKTNNAYLKSFSPIIVANFHLASFELEKESPNIDSVISKFKYCLSSGLDVFSLPEYLSNKHKLESNPKFREAFAVWKLGVTQENGEVIKKDEPMKTDSVPVEDPKPVSRAQSTPVQLPSINLKDKLNKDEDQKQAAETAVEPTKEKEPVVLSPKTEPKKSIKEQLKSPKKTEPVAEPVTPKTDTKVPAKTPRESLSASRSRSNTNTSAELPGDAPSDATKSPLSPKTAPKTGTKETGKTDSTKKSATPVTSSTDRTASPSRLATYSPSATRKDTTTSSTPTTTAKKTTVASTSSPSTPPTTGLKRPSVLKKPSGGNLTGSQSAPTVTSSNVTASPSAEKDVKPNGSATTTGSPATSSGLKRPTPVSGLKQPTPVTSPTSGLKKFSSAKK